MALAAYSAVVHSRYRGAAVLSVPLAAVLTVGSSRTPRCPQPRATSLLIFIPVVLVGDVVRRWARRRRLRERLRRAEAEHHAATMRALAAERSRIASELHDVVTHNVSVMVVQAGAARRVLRRIPRGREGTAGRGGERPHGPGRAAAPAWAALPGRGRMRRASRAAGAGAGARARCSRLAPQPGLDDLRSLVDRVATAGLPVELTVTGHRGRCRLASTWPCTGLCRRRSPTR